MLAKLHVNRTAEEPRQKSFHYLRIESTSQGPSANVRVIRMKQSDDKEPIKFLPGQWLDVHIAGVGVVGGFSITSTPRDAEEHGEVELAVQFNVRNASAAWFWQRMPEIDSKVVKVRVGGSFHWPPRDVEPKTISRLLLIAGGVGINPIMSILSHLHQNPSEVPLRINLLYSTRIPPQTIHEGNPKAFKPQLDTYLFLRRLNQLFSTPPFTNPPDTEAQSCSSSSSYKATIFLTPPWKPSVGNSTFAAYNKWCQANRGTIWNHEDRKVEDGSLEHMAVDTRFGRVGQVHLDNVLKDLREREGMVAYVCGPQQMTDEMVEILKKMEGVRPDRVLCEKWW